MPNKRTAPYGSWKSPITADLIVAQTIRLSGTVLDQGNIYWLEGRPQEGGRNVLVRRTVEGQTEDVTPPPFDVRTRVHEYGGGAFLVSEGVVYFSNDTDQRLYRQERNAAPKPLTGESAMRYADGVVDRRRDRIICVREDHSTGGREPLNTLVAVALAGGGTGGVLASGNDFYSSPRLSPDGSRLAWLAWNHPHMPWDGTELWVGEFDSAGEIGRKQRVAGGPRESIFQPEWSPDGVLHFVSDRAGWWNLYRWGQGRAECLCEMEAEFGQPQWVFGQSTYAFVNAEKIVCAYVRNGVSHLALLDGTSGKLEEVKTSYEAIGYVRATDDFVVFCGASPKEFPSIVRLDLRTRKTEVLRRSSQANVDARCFSIPKTIEFSTGNGLTAHAFYYPPHNPDFIGPSGEKPPLLVLSHGGPTSATTSALDLRIQYWTSRGIGVLDVNYGGSTGYGRAYRERLNGQWGVVDVEDCIHGAQHLVQRGEVDGDRLIIRGGSAGGYTTLCALTFHDVFKAGASYYGIGDLEALETDTHKFEAKYNHSLIAPYPEQRELYRKRSPIHFVDRLSCPIIFFQGLEDTIVPPNQSEKMVEAMRKKGLPVAYVTFEGEQHGFRRAESIKRSLKAELYFYSCVFGFDLADPVEPVEIWNL